MLDPHKHKSIVVINVKRVDPFVPRPTDYCRECSLLVVDNECNHTTNALSGDNSGCRS
jgi:hypothetical protein